MAEAPEFFSRQDKHIVRGVYTKKIDGADNSTSETSTPPRFEEGRGVHWNKKLKLDQGGGSPCVFFPDKTIILLGGFSQRKKTGQTIISQRRAQPQVLGMVGVFISRKKIETCPPGTILDPG